MPNLVVQIKHLCCEMLAIVSKDNESVGEIQERFDGGVEPLQLQGIHPRQGL